MKKILRLIFVVTVLLFANSQLSIVNCQSPVDRRYDYYFHEATRLRIQKKYDASYDMLQHCLAIRPHSPSALYELAQYYIVLKQIERGTATMEEAVKYAPDNYWYAQGLANLYVQQNKLDEATVLLEDMAKRFPSKIDVTYSLLQVYSRQAKYDKNYIITSLAFARNLFQQEGRLTSLELRLKPGSNFDRVKADIQALCGDKFLVRDRFEQQDDTFKIMKIEKFIAYIFLTFILIVACFNIIGSLSMLIIDKKDDVVTLRNLGATDKQITRIFLFEGRLIAAIGAVIGILLGLLLCWLQQTFGIVKLGSSSGSFIVNAYPVSVHPEDIILILVTVILVGWLAVWYPVRYFSRRLLA